LNGVPVPVQPPENWKRVQTVSVERFVRPGTNLFEVRVLNPSGPPAMWATLTGLPGTEVITDASWQVSYGGSDWRSATVADGRADVLRGQLAPESLQAAALQRWPWLLGCFLAALALPLVARRLPALKWSPDTLALVLIGVLWSLPLLHNLQKISPNLGFDTHGHQEYIELILKEGRLPALDAGWETHQPPLYYLLSAGVLKTFGLVPGTIAAATALKLLSLVIGWAHLGCVLASLRLLFPGRTGLRVAGVVFAGGMPMLLYLSHFITNELLAACLISAALYLAIRVVIRAESGLGCYAGLGVAIGLAILTKITALFLLPCVGISLAVRAWKSEEKNARTGLVTVFGLAGLICGWYFVRSWQATGHLLFAPNEWSYGLGWWQDPGYRTAGYFLRFGESLSQPFFSSAASFWDGLYSTLWGDALAGGATSLATGPAWDYLLIQVSITLAVLPTIVLLLGCWKLLSKIRSAPHAGWALLGSYGVLMLLALLHLNLSVPAYGVAKAFYGLSALMPLSVLAVLGWDWLASRSPRAAWVVGVLTGLTLLASYSAYWVRTGSPAPAAKTEVQSALEQIAAAYKAEDVSATIEQCRAGLVLAPLDPEIHFYLGMALEAQARQGATNALGVYLFNRAGLTNSLDRMIAAATEHYAYVALIAPSTTDAFSRLGWILATHRNPLLRDAKRARDYAQRAVALVPENPLALRSLAAAEAESGDWAQAAQTAEKALALARDRNMAPLAAHLERLAATFKAGQPWRQ
jgi:tetratricopeptide (TPR) repeat protein